MGVAYSGGDNSLAGVVLLIISLAISWLFIYSAVRAAVGHALDRVKPRLLAEAHTTPLGVEFAVSNIGTAPAFAVSVGWADRPIGQPLAWTPMLAVNGRLEWTLAAQPVPDETQSVRRLSIGWSTGLVPSEGRRSELRAVLVPSRLDILR
jgi:hypothetical protein